MTENTFFRAIMAMDGVFASVMVGAVLTGTSLSPWTVFAAGLFIAVQAIIMVLIISSESR